MQEAQNLEFKRMAVHNNRLEEDTLQDSNEELLEKLLLLENDHLKRAAILLFHPKPERWVSNAFVKIGFFADDHANLRHHDEVHGTLFDQVFNTIEVLKLKYLKAVISYDGIVRQERFPVPLEALREAVLNAVVHKDYASAAPIQISVYPDKIMIWNPGELPDSWTLDTLLNKHSSRPFNPDIANAFFRSGLIESWGRGIERIIKACENNGNPTPEWQVSGGDFWAIFHFAYRNEMVDVESRPESRPESQLASDILDLLGNAELSKAELAEKLGHKTVSGELNKQVRSLLKEGFIEMTIPDKPSSRLQRYRLTSLGQSMVGK